jgi:hypothetical protein
VLAFLTGLPAGIVALTLLWTGDFTSKVQWTLTVLIVGFWWGCAMALRERVILPLQTVSNLLAALREGTTRSVAGRRRDDPLAEVMHEVNALGKTLRSSWAHSRLTALLQTVMSEIEVAVFAFDGEQRLRLVNRQVSGCFIVRSSNCWGGAPQSSGSMIVFNLEVREPFRRPFRELLAAGESGGAPFAREACRINCW